MDVHSFANDGVFQLSSLQARRYVGGSLKWESVDRLRQYVTLVAYKMHYALHSAEYGPRHGWVLHVPS